MLAIRRQRADVAREQSRAPPPAQVRHHLPAVAHRVVARPEVRDPRAGTVGGIAPGWPRRPPTVDRLRHRLGEDEAGFHADDRDAVGHRHVRSRSPCGSAPPSSRRTAARCRQGAPGEAGGRAQGLQFRRGGGDVHDQTTAVFAHRGPETLDEHERRGDIHREALFPLVAGELGNVGDTAFPTVYAALFTRTSTRRCRSSVTDDQPIQVLRRSKVGRHHQRVAAEARIAAAVSARVPGVRSRGPSVLDASTTAAPLGELQARLLADAAARAGDDGDLARERPAHCSSLPTPWPSRVASAIVRGSKASPITRRSSIRAARAGASSLRDAAPGHQHDARDVGNGPLLARVHVVQGDGVIADGARRTYSVAR